MVTFVAVKFSTMARASPGIPGGAIVPADSKKADNFRLLTIVMMSNLLRIDRKSVKKCSIVQSLKQDGIKGFDKDFAFMTFMTEKDIKTLEHPDLSGTDTIPLPKNLKLKLKAPLAFCHYLSHLNKESMNMTAIKARRLP